MDIPSSVVGVGTAGVDTKVYLHGQEIDFSVESNFIQNIDYLGLTGGYASRGYNCLGRCAAYIGYVGDDLNGRMMP